MDNVSRQYGLRRATRRNILGSRELALWSRSDLLTCKHIKGILTAEDSVAFSQEERAIDEATSCGDGTSCTLACDGGTSNAYGVSYAIKLAMPEQLAPHNKYLHATFQPDGDGLPETLTSHSVQAVVIEGDIPLSAKETIKLPEYIPFMILRDPPGSLSSSSWTKETSSAAGLSVEMEDSGTYMLGANVVGGSYSKTDVKAGVLVGSSGFGYHLSWRIRFKANDRR